MAIPHSGMPIEDAPSVRRILRLAAPLIFATTGQMLMQFIDGVFLSWHSPEAIAAVGPAGMAAFLVVSPFLGAAMYTATLTAQSIGARRPRQVGPILWQGLYLCFGGAILVAACAAFSGPVFNRLGHDPIVAAYEIRYFSILSLGALATLAAANFSGFFAGLGQTRLLMWVQLLGFALNAILDYGLIFGRLGFPALGVAGAALATVIAQLTVALLLFAAFRRRRYRQPFNTAADRRFTPRLFWMLVRFGIPNGLRMTVEVSAWMVFLFFVGRLGTLPLAATSIAWRINGIAFFPIIGLSDAIRILVGQARGMRRFDWVRQATWRGIAIAQIWMAIAILVFLLFPEALYEWFRTSGDAGAIDFDAIAAVGVILLRFVAVYCPMDSFVMILLGVLQALGDTRWTLILSLFMSLLFIAALALTERAGFGLYGEWTVATTYLIVYALVLLWRFQSARWQHIDVIGGTNAVGG